MAVGRKLIVCCDGTWNEPYQIGSPTNVAKMVRALNPVDGKGVPQLVHYHPGVGTGNIVDRFMGGVLGVGLSSNVQSCYDFLANNHSKGDRIYLFGFSRGAFTARSLAGLIGLVGLLKKRKMDLFPYLYDIYRSRTYRPVLRPENRGGIVPALREFFGRQITETNLMRLLEAIEEAREAKVHFIGVWDTVGALGIPWSPLRWIGRSKYNFHDTGLGESVKFAYQALAIDEARKNFAPALWHRPAGSGPERKQALEQMWFAGVHSNVGGGYPDTGLSDIAFLWMVAKATAASMSEDDIPLAFDEVYLKERIVSTLGSLMNSRRGFWRLLPRLRRQVLAPPPPGKETCEFIHRSVSFRYRCEDVTAYSPYPYRPGNTGIALDLPGYPIVPELTAFETKFRRATE